MSDAPAHDWSPQQLQALRAVECWFGAENAPQVFRLFGYAGTGKTTLAIEIARRIRELVKKDEGTARGAVMFAAFTGKAALVMRSKGCHGAGTIHSLIYELDEENAGQPKFVLNHASPLSDAKLLIVDECSMVGEELGRDLLSFGVKILVLGDPAQLPPVGDGTGFFTNHKPNVMLSEVHRQAAGNPIIKLSMDIRAGSRLHYGDYGACKVVPWTKTAVGRDLVLGADQVLCGKNATRHTFNARFRELKGIDGPNPAIGEKLVCLRNDREKGLFNGGLWRVEKYTEDPRPDALEMIVQPEDAGEVKRAVDVKVHPLFLVGRERELQWEDIRDYQQFCFGYALTVHKAQGSQWNNVVLFDESGAFREDRMRWLYTGVTRAAETLTVVRS